MEDYVEYTPSAPLPKIVIPVLESSDETRVQSPASNSVDEDHKDPNFFQNKIFLKENITSIDSIKNRVFYGYYHTVK
jgi:hypothetical protein